MNQLISDYTKLSGLIPKAITIDNTKTYYIDEGEGNTILFVHGTPDSSLGYRHLINGLKQHYRCISMDNIGFGLSEKTANEDYSVEKQSKRLIEFIDKLSLDNITLYLHDFGGPIGLNAAIQIPDKISRIFITNTWGWDLSIDKNFANAAIMNGNLGRWLYLSYGFSVKFMMKNAYHNRKKLEPAIFQYYLNVFSNKIERTPTFKYLTELFDANPLFGKIFNNREKLSNIPKHLIWGMNDKFFKPYMIEQWKDFGVDSINQIMNCGHFLQEESPDDVIEILKDKIKA